ncbi:ATP-binding protein [Fodinicola feengrottensis]|uniref:Histidine kinase/HSP90-like ATPase domain-containing protein n=2 Tax=Fodinicola feengrottensis TaxID=435914 RepID=A0ABP4SHP3_9ACTN|nr:ATP-binding protein [Fodinicola feengrottensis]
MSVRPTAPNAGHQNEYELTVVDGDSLELVRRSVRELMAGYVGIAIDDAVLVAYELVSNALRHGLPPCACRLIAVDESRSLRIEVDDASADTPRVRTPDLSGGRGLFIVNQLASSWGVICQDAHKTVWAEMNLSHSGDRHADNDVMDSNGLPHRGGGLGVHRAE